MTELQSPYPGLRPFKVDESHLFFGREEQTDELLHRLHATRFLAVVGPSGCGKSSLVRAGMVAALGAGFLVAAGARWQFAIMRPESRPMHGLARALVEQAGVGLHGTDAEIATGFLDATLRRGPLGVVEALRETPLPADTNLLILVDQFEEIFRFEREGGRDEADAFVSLLLATARQREVPVYVVITMRSDFFGDCAIFEGLPEALNESQYLTPRLTREQRQAAIVGPARVFGGDVAPDLVNRLLNQMGTDPDQLPLMQHLLIRMWTWRIPPREGVDWPGDAGIADEPDGAGRRLTLADCDAVGGLNHALSRHADEAFAELDDRQKSIAATLFRILSERAPGNRDIRRPTAAGEAAELAGASLDELVAVVETFRTPGRSFIVPPFPEPITAERVLDITHESLIRQWERLRDWAETEEKSADIYRFLAKTAALWKQGESALWQSPNLELALDWRKREQPTALWARRYGGDFELAMLFLAESEKATETREAEIAAKRLAAVRRWRLAFASASAVAALLLVAVGYVYEAEFAEHIRYYNTFVKRFGEPVGVGELSPDQIRHRAASLKIVRKGFLNPVLRMEAVDAEGNCTPQNGVGTYLQTPSEVENGSPLHECRWEFVYDDKGEVVYEKAYDSEGQLRWGYSYTPGEEERKFRTASYVDRDGFPARFKNSLAEIVRFDYSESGYEIRRSYRDRQGHPQPGPDRAYGQEREYDARGLETRETSLDRLRLKMNDTSGNATQVLAYDRLGDPTVSKYLDKDNRPVLIKEGYGEVRSGYDENGNRTWVALFDIAGRPTLNKNGVHLAKIACDEKGYVKEISYYDTGDNPTVSNEGFHKLVYLARDAQGHQLQWAFFGIAGEKTTDSQGVHEYRASYDPRGFRVSSAAFDKEGQPTTVRGGYHSLELQYDQNGNITSQAYFDREGRPTRHNDGNHRVNLTYDERGNIRERAYFDAQNQPVVVSSGYHRETAQYNDAGFRIEVEFFGKHGEPVISDDGYHKRVMAFDSRGNQTEISYFDANNKPVNGTEKFARMTNAHDARDNIVEWAYYGPDGRLTGRGEGYAILRQEYDEQDRVTKKAYYDDKDRLTTIPQGYAVSRWQYDGNEQDERYYDAAGRRISLNGCVTWRSINDPRTGKATEGACRDEQDRPVRRRSGSAFVQIKYDEHGREVEKASYGEDHHLISGPNFAIVREKYDDHGNKVEEAYFGEDEKLRLGPDGCAMFRSKYDDHGKQTEIAYFGEDGKLRVHPKFGYAIVREKYDDRENPTEFTYFGEDGELRHRSESFAMVRMKYDDNGNEIEKAWYGEDQHLMSSPNYAVAREKYDDRGNKIEEAYFGEDEKLRIGPDGYAMFRSKYDDHGNQTEIAYFGEDEKPHVPPNEGYAIARGKYDDHGNKLEWATFGEDGELRSSEQGYAVQRMKYDADGKLTDLSYFSADGALTSSTEGFASITKLTEIVLRDERQHFRARCQNDEIADFRKSPNACTDADGSPVVTHPKILEITPQSRAEELGLRVGDVIESYAGKPVFLVQELVDLITRPGEETRRIDLLRQGHRLTFEAPPGKLGMRIGLTFVAANQSPPAEHAGR